MTAHVRIQAPVLGDIDDFIEVCEQQVWFVAEGWISLHTAVDNLQALAERWGLVDTPEEQDTVQRLMSDAFAPVPDLPSDYTLRLVRDWELADERDRWRWTGELPPKPNLHPEWPPRKPYETPPATVDAFFYVVAAGSGDYLADWLARHPLDAPHLHKLWKAKCSTAPAT